MLNFILSGVGVAIKVAAPIFVPPLMSRLERLLPQTGSGSNRREVIHRAFDALARSLEDDGAISDQERDEIVQHVLLTIEVFLPLVEAQSKE